MATEGKKTITTSSGFVCEIDDDTMDDMELFETVVAFEDAKGAQKLIHGARLMTGLLGEEQKEKLYAYLREKDPKGKVRVSAFSKELTEILAGMNDGKKK